MSKCNIFNPAICTCFHRDARDCSRCVISPWDYTVNSITGAELRAQLNIHHHAVIRYEEKVLEEIRSVTSQVIWLRHTEKQAIYDVLHQTIKEEVTKYITRRHQLIQLIIPTIEDMLAQHFLILTEKLNAPFTSKYADACFTCRYIDHFEPFPPKNFREWLVENILASIDKSAITDEQKKNVAYHVSQRLVHKWLRARPEERVKMGL
jgi:hypothetical protein